MSDEARPAEVERTTAPEYKPSDKYMELAAAAEKIAQSADDFGQKVEHLTTVQKEMAEERKKLRPVNRPESDRIGVEDVAELMDSRTDDPEVIKLHELSDRAIDRMAVRLVQSKSVMAGTELRFDRVNREAWDDVPEFKDLKRKLATKAAGSWWDSTTTDSVGGTSGWVPTEIMSTAVDFYTLDADLPMLFDNITIPRGAGTIAVPTEDVQAYAFYETQQTAKTNPVENVVNTNVISNAQVTRCELTGKKITNIQGITMEAVEDSAVDLLARGRRNGMRAVMHGINQAIINGQDSDDADLDDADTTSGYYAANDFSNSDGDSGLRLQAVLNSYTTAIGGSIAATDVLAGRKEMGKFGARPDEVSLITSPKGYLGMLSDSAVLTVDKYGGQATVLTGELARVGGVRIFMDSEFSEDLDTAGINANAATTGITGALLVNNRRWLFGTARALEQTIVPQPGFDNVWVITRARVDFETMITDEHNVHYLINVT